MGLHVTTLSTLPLSFGCQVNIFVSLSCSQRTVSERFEPFSLVCIKISRT
jgi:hypothetical protein